MQTPPPDFPRKKYNNTPKIIIISPRTYKNLPKWRFFVNFSVFFLFLGEVCIFEGDFNFIRRWANF
jgi:hypothetical protein